MAGGTIDHLGTHCTLSQPYFRDVAIFPTAFIVGIVSVHETVDVACSDDQIVLLPLPQTPRTRGARQDRQNVSWFYAWPSKAKEALFRLDELVRAELRGSIGMLPFQIFFLFEENLRYFFGRHSIKQSCQVVSLQHPLVSSSCPWYSPIAFIIDDPGAGRLLRRQDHVCRIRSWLVRHRATRRFTESTSWL